MGRTGGSTIVDRRVRGRKAGRLARALTGEPGDHSSGAGLGEREGRRALVDGRREAIRGARDNLEIRATAGITAGRPASSCHSMAREK